jgi:hypothetical protein
MKLLILTFSLLYLSSCHKHQAEIENRQSVNNKKILTETAINPDDTIHWALIDSYLEYPETGSTGVEKIVENIKTTNYKIVNRISVDTLNFLTPDSEFGIIAYNIPNNFRVEEWTTIKLRISRNGNIEKIIVGERNIPIVGVGSDDNIILDMIKVDEFISAFLYGDSDRVDIKLATRQLQKMSDSNYVEWVWRVMPKKPGLCYIKMIITISQRDLVVYEENIPIKSGWYWKLLKWFGKWWQAITVSVITPIVIPFIIWYRKRRSKKDA